MIHKLAECISEQVPESTNIWQYVVVLKNAKIGHDCNICAHCFIENDVILGYFDWSNVGITVKKINLDWIYN